MKLARFSGSRVSSYGVLDGDQIICLPILAKALMQPFPPNLEVLISQGVEESRIKHLLQSATKTTLKNAAFSLDKVKLLAPIMMPPKIICLGLNYKDHISEQGTITPDEPVIFIKPHTTLIGPNESIIKPKFVKQLDYEAELTIVIGKEAKKVSINSAKAHIFGYTILNDVSARDVQFKDKQWTRGKSFDTFAPTGPWITTVNQIKDPTNLQICTRVNEELRQDSNTRNMVFNVFEIIHHLSHIMTLEPCDLIATGTPAGVGFAMKPKPKFLQEGDVVEIEIQGIGLLRNNVVAEKLTL